MDNQKPNQPEEKQPSIPAHYFLISGQIEFQESKHNKASRAQLVNSVYRSDEQGLTAKHLGKCQQNLQMAFHRMFSRTHKQPPFNISNVIMIASSYLGMYTEEEFLAGAQPEAKTPNRVAADPEITHAANAGETSNAQS
jgi:hypothetical protein